MRNPKKNFAGSAGFKSFVAGIALLSFAGLPLALAAPNQLLGNPADQLSGRSSNQSRFINNLTETKKTIQVQAQKGEEIKMAIQPQKKHHYTMCVAPHTGDADLYGRFMNGSRILASQTSTNRGIWPGQNIPYRDCVVFETASKGTINITIKAIEDFAGDFYFIGTPYNNVPSGFEKELISPLENPQTTTPKWGPFGSPWGNDLAEYNPFYEKSFDGFLHGGTDIVATAGTGVKAACNGTIRRNGMLDDDTPSGWGGYTILECTSPLNGATISLAYDHIDPNSALEPGTPIGQNDIIGKVYNILVPGEENHIHLTICNGTYDTCAQINQQPQRGALPFSDFPGKWVESDPHKNIGLFK